MNINQLEAETVEMLPGREALGRFSFNLTKLSTVSTKVANLGVHNESTAANQFSPLAVAQSAATQAVSVRQ
ncbi:hypothetical protein [Streptomyces heilongjiangensis]|uniref:FXSXX-COOH protein n=1 Tax=Streptomyces heilongjiangensis TaxID=945052 RepID=A0ABW1B8Y3_9ACTN|nr:hypothetical protein [Streptomyces heilongjiangensis]MDC2951596.1 hypothetical protein [Streptomyces heilongjiangensis]